MVNQRDSDLVIKRLVPILGENGSRKGGLKDSHISWRIEGGEETLIGSHYHQDFITVQQFSVRVFEEERPTKRNYDQLS